MAIILCLFFEDTMSSPLSGTKMPDPAMVPRCGIAVIKAGKQNGVRAGGRNDVFPPVGDKDAGPSHGQL